MSVDEDYITFATAKDHLGERDFRNRMATLRIRAGRWGSLTEPQKKLVQKALQAIGVLESAVYDAIQGPKGSPPVEVLQVRALKHLQRFVRFHQTASRNRAGYPRELRRQIVLQVVAPEMLPALEAVLEDARQSPGELDDPAVQRKLAQKLNEKLLQLPDNFQGVQPHDLKNLRTKTSQALACELLAKCWGISAQDLQHRRLRRRPAGGSHG